MATGGRLSKLYCLAIVFYFAPSHIDFDITQQYNCVMIPPFEKNSKNLPPGIHWTTWQEIVERFGTNPERRKIISGLKKALKSLNKAKCQRVYIDGSFVTTKEIPGDFDACWDIAGVDPELLDPVFFEFESGRAAQKKKFYGELFPASWVADNNGNPFLEFFQLDKETGNQKGIVALELEAFFD